ncbi:Homoserine dehydrogenase [Candidatus Portiera aleyrodidarum]|uniref:Homoserine dehydrogenase n=1 Tax=Candidatus Portiera aleyrodidarum TV TaxID=1297582 RepID=A0A8D3XAI2_9GAMM|nr:homoserine dehydrogenase [Candidatus Portiera aleyrodidarum]AGI27086.1 homoserine dehydrogenase [Candidatus Portiera aleyrodidarum TV]CEI59051.1 Homoserine dehydrogenase [Candidatus Portiera aleyrodidarum]
MIRIGICGLGTVGGGTFNILKRNYNEIFRRIGRPIIIEQIGTRSDNQICNLTGSKVTRNIFEVVRNHKVDYVVELIGGGKVARKLVVEAINNKKHVVTANKAMIAIQGKEIFCAAEKRGVMVAFEAAVAGGIPIIKSLREGLCANRINSIAGIINGTVNYILTKMKNGIAGEEILNKAKVLGYAEEDPTLDIEGIDTAQKLTILASIAYGIPLQFEKIYIEGIKGITIEDVKQAEKLGYNIKHLGISKRKKKGIELRVHPVMIPKKRLISNVKGVKNAIEINGDAVGATLYVGIGAGSEPTASAIVADLLDVSRDHYLAFSNMEKLPILPIDQIITEYYLRFMLLSFNMIGQVANIFYKQGIRIKHLIQIKTVSSIVIIILTYSTKESNMKLAIGKIESTNGIVGHITRIRVEKI